MPADRHAVVNPGPKQRARRRACHRQPDHALTVVPRHRRAGLDGASRASHRAPSSTAPDHQRPSGRAKSRASVNSSVGRQRTTVLHSHDRKQPTPICRHFRVACYPHAVKVTEILKLLQQDGWVLVATRGSHRQYKHGSKPGRVTARQAQRRSCTWYTEQHLEAVPSKVRSAEPCDTP